MATKIWRAIFHSGMWFSYQRRLPYMSYFTSVSYLRRLILKLFYCAIFVMLDSLQEQIAELLGIKSFKRKYPELSRRTIEISEREYLMGQYNLATVINEHR